MFPNYATVSFPFSFLHWSLLILCNRHYEMASRILRIRSHAVLQPLQLDTLVALQGSWIHLHICHFLDRPRPYIFILMFRLAITDNWLSYSSSKRHSDWRHCSRFTNFESIQFKSQTFGESASNNFEFLFVSSQNNSNGSKVICIFAK